jgi:hypothetical protein
VLIAAFLDENVDRITVLINSTPKIVHFAANRDKHFIQEPSVTQAASAHLQPAGVIWAKSIAPLTN